MCRGPTRGKIIYVQLIQDDQMLKQQSCIKENIHVLLLWRSLNRNESGRFGALKSDSTHYFFRNACTTDSTWPSHLSLKIQVRLRTCTKCGRVKTINGITNAALPFLIRVTHLDFQRKMWRPRWVSWEVFCQLRTDDERWHWQLDFGIKWTIFPY
jgi:hypothetical protein